MFHFFVGHFILIPWYTCIFFPLYKSRLGTRFRPCAAMLVLVVSTSKPAFSNTPIGRLIDSHHILQGAPGPLLNWNELKKVVPVHHDKLIYSYAPTQKVVPGPKTYRNRVQSPYRATSLRQAYAL